jgi:hypothetical protein
MNLDMKLGMKSLRKNVTVFFCLSMSMLGSVSFAGGFSDCYAKAYQVMNNDDAVKACKNAGSGFSVCYDKAYQVMNVPDSVNACLYASSDFLECYDKAYQTKNVPDSIRTCTGP